jgi:hypothetical protein
MTPACIVGGGVSQPCEECVDLPTCVQEKGAHAGRLCLRSSAFAAGQVKRQDRPEGA